MAIEFKNWKISVAKYEETLEICEVFKNSVLHVSSQHPQYSKDIINFWNQGKTHQKVSAWITNPDHFFIVAKNREKIEGVAFINIKKGLFVACYLLKSATKHGLGKKLMSSMTQMGKANGHSRLTLGASLNAVDFYKKIGFSVTKDHSDLRPPKGVPHYSMEIQL